MISLMEVCGINVSLSKLELINVSAEIDEESSIIIVHIADLILQILVPVRRIIVSIRTVIVLSSPRVSDTKEPLPVAFSDE